MKRNFRAPLAPPYIWPVAIDPWQLSGPGEQGGGGGSRTTIEETSPLWRLVVLGENAPDVDPDGYERPRTGPFPRSKLLPEAKTGPEVTLPKQQ